MSNIIWISDWDIKGSGYTNLSAVLATELIKRGHIVVGYGLAYQKHQHNWPFGVVGVGFRDLPSIVATLTNSGNFQGLVVALDIPQQINFLKNWKKVGIPYTGIFAVESDPISNMWAMNLMPMANPFTISQFGADECQKVGIDAKHLPIPVNLDVFKKREPGERERLKEALGLTGKTVFFMNADGNERKNTALVYETLARIKQIRQDFHFILLTRKNSPVGWDYDDLASRYNLHGFVTIMERGLPQEQVRNLYASSDFVLNLSKAEGLGLSVREAQAVGVPVIATNVTGMKESLADGRGIAVEPDFSIIDIFGNGRRYFVGAEHASQVLLDAMNTDYSTFDPMIERARAFVETIKPETSADLLEKVFNV